jgi:molecular chaperone GrpE
MEEKKESMNSDILNALRQDGTNLSDLDGELDAINEKDDRIAKLTEENNQLKDKFLRTVAELENVRRISVEEKEKTAKYAISNFASSLIPVMESFFLAFNNVEREKIESTFLEGITLVFNELKKVFEKFGLGRVYPIGEEFDPDVHQAIAQVDSEEKENKIVDVAQAGYILNDRVLKPALVMVSNGNGSKK